MKLLLGTLSFFVIACVTAWDKFVDWCDEVICP